MTQDIEMFLVYAELIIEKSSTPKAFHMYIGEKSAL
jgi:hypothetical protein